MEEELEHERDETSLYIRSIFKVARPPRLSYLTLDALGKYLSNLIVQSVTFQQQAKIEDIKIKHIQAITTHLAERIHQTIPPAMANKVTKRLLEVIEATYSELVRYVEDCTSINRVVLFLIQAVLHPSVTRIECYHDKLHPCKDDWYYMPIRISHMIVECCQKLSNLKVLRLKDRFYDVPDSFGDGYQMTETLEEFSFDGCTDALLQSLSSTCSRLKVLNISKSRVTDASFDYLIRFKYLESLNIENTLISEEVFTRLLEVLSNTQVITNNESCTSSLLLTNLECSCIEIPQIYLLANKFTNISALTFSTVFDNYDWTPLKALTRLKKLNISSNHFFYIQEIFEILGRQLECLALDYVDVDFNHVAQHCPYLKCFHLELERYNEGDYPQDLKLPVFPSVQCLSVDSCMYETERLVSQFPNLTHLYIRNGSNSLFQKLIKRDELKSLRYVNIESNYVTLEVHLSEELIFVTEITARKLKTFKEWDMVVPG